MAPPPPPRQSRNRLGRLSPRTRHGRRLPPPHASARRSLPHRSRHALAQMVRHLARQQNLQPPVAHYPNRFAPALRPRQVSPLRLPPRPASLAPRKFPALPHPQRPPRARSLLPPRTAPHAQRLLSH